MDDNRRKASFPVLSTRVTAMQPTDGQVMAFLLSAKGNLRERELDRVVRIVESLLSPDDWKIIEDALISGEMNVKEFFAFVSDVFHFKWPTADQKPADPVTEEPAADNGPQLL